MLSLWQFLFIFSCFHLLLSLSRHAVLFPDSHMIYGIRLINAGCHPAILHSTTFHLPPHNHLSISPLFARPRIILMSPSPLHPVTWVYTPTLLHSQCPLRSIPLPPISNERLPIHSSTVLQNEEWKYCFHSRNSLFYPLKIAKNGQKTPKK